MLLPPPLLLVMLLLLPLEHVLREQRQLGDVRAIRGDPEQEPGYLPRGEGTLESCHHLFELGVLSLEQRGDRMKKRQKRSRKIKKKRTGGRASTY